MHKLIGLIICLLSASVVAQSEEKSGIKFAFYSSAWGENTDDGLRLVAYNQTSDPIRLSSILLHSTSEDVASINIPVELNVPTMGYADIEFEYIDLLKDDACIDRTMADNWKLVEISNYTLNPSVRNLIIENTDSFRIYQCVRNVTLSWTDLNTDDQQHFTEWVLYHFETRLGL